MTSKLNQSIELTTGKVANLVRHCEASIQRSLGPTDSLERVSLGLPQNAPDFAVYHLH